MTTTPTQRTVRGDHGNYVVVGNAISKGGVGGIFRTTNPKWVYKEYHSLDKAPSDAHLRRLVTVGRDVLITQGMPVAERPESSINWPVDIVRRPDGRIVGCILPAIPTRFFHPEHGNVNTLMFLVMVRSDPPTAKFRLAVLLRMAEILRFVHQKGLVHGDVNAANVAWTVNPEPAAYLIDCDGMVPQDPSPQEGVQAPYWTDPRVEDRLIPAQDQYSDWYCLALAFYRGLLLPDGGSLGKKNGVWPAPSNIPSHLDSRVATLLRRGLADPLDHSTRPEPGEWVTTMIEVYVHGNRYDEAALSKLDGPLEERKRMLAKRQQQPQPTTTHFTNLPPTVRPQIVHPPGRPTQWPTAHHPPAPHTYQPVQPTYQPPPQPVYQHPTYRQPTHQQPPYQQPTYQPPGYPPPQYSPPGDYGKPPGAMARWALDGGVRWYLPLCLLVLGCWPIGAGVCALVLIQTLMVDRNHYGRTAALISSGIGLGIGVITTLCLIASPDKTP
jgi:hypothetical protein